MKDLVIIGMGPHACEMVDIIERHNRHLAGSECYRLIGFVSSVHKSDEELGLKVYPIEALDGDLRDAALIPLHWVDLELKLKYRSRMISIVDPSCFVSRTARIGLGCILFPDCFVGQRGRGE